MAVLEVGLEGLGSPLELDVCPRLGIQTRSKGRETRSLSGFKERGRARNVDDEPNDVVLAGPCWQRLLFVVSQGRPCTVDLKGVGSFDEMEEHEALLKHRI